MKIKQKEPALVLDEANKKNRHKNRAVLATAKTARYMVSTKLDTKIS